MWSLLSFCKKIIFIFNLLESIWDLFLVSPSPYYLTLLLRFPEQARIHSHINKNMIKKHTHTHTHIHIHINTQVHILTHKHVHTHWFLEIRSFTCFCLYCLSKCPRFNKCLFLNFNQYFLIISLKQSKQKKKIDCWLFLAKFVRQR